MSIVQLLSIDPFTVEVETTFACGHTATVDLEFPRYPSEAEVEEEIRELRTQPCVDCENAGK